MLKKKIPVIVAVAGLLFLNLACSDDDDPVGPGDITVTDPRLEPLQAEGTALAQKIIEIIPVLAQGQLGSKDETDPWFDGTCTCWRWNESDGDFSDPIQEWGRSTDYGVTFYNGGTPQMEFEGADRIALELSFNYWETHFDDVAKAEGKKYSSKLVSFVLALQATGFSAGTVTVTGSGVGEVSGGISVGEGWEGYFESIEISVNLTVPFIGCPTGSIDLDMEEASFRMGFDGSSMANWSYSAGPGDPLTGTFSILCGSR